MPRSTKAGSATLPATIRVHVEDGPLALGADATPATADAVVDYLVGLLTRARAKHAALRHQVEHVGGGALDFVDDEGGARKRLGFIA